MDRFRDWDKSIGKSRSGAKRAVNHTCPGQTSVTRTDEASSCRTCCPPGSKGGWQPCTTLVEGYQEDMSLDTPDQ